MPLDNQQLRGLRYENLTDEHKDHIKKLYSDKSKSWSKKLDEISEYLGVSTRTVMRWLAKAGFSSGKKIEDSPIYQEATKRKSNKEKEVYIFTWAQNASRIHEPLWNNILAYKEFHNAEIHVVPGVYRSGKEKIDSYWPSEVIDYLDASRQKIHKYVTFLGDVKTIPTAKYPLTGFESFSDDGLIIVGHPKMHLETLPVLQNNPPKYTVTTGTITRPKYTESKAGAIAEFYHMYGFLIVEIEDKNTYYFRQVNADISGNFIDLIYQVKEGVVSEIENIAAAVLGDIHEIEIDEEIDKETIRILNRLQPKCTIIHDLFDAKSIKYHDRKDPILLYEKHLEGTDILKTEVDSSLDWLEKYETYNPTVVSANHHDMLDRWLRDWDWRKDIKNALEYAKYLQATLEGKAKKGILAYEIEKRFGEKIRCLDRDDSLRVKGYELAYHGDMGVNGSRGTPKQYARLGIKNVIAHGHSITRYNGSLTSGTMTPLRVGYNKGPSSWSQGHVIIHTDGRAQTLVFAANKKVTKFF